MNLARPALAVAAAVAACGAPAGRAPAAGAPSAPAAQPAAGAPHHEDAAAAAGAPDPALPSGDAEPAPLPGEDELRDAAIRALEDGEFGRARDLVEDLIVGSRLQEAQRLLDAGRPLEAVALFEHIRREAPGREEALLPYAESSLRAGRELGEPALVERALATFSQIDGDPAAAFGASRAATALGRTDEALRFAREGLRRLDARGGARGLVEPGERTWAQASLDAFDLARRNGSAEADALRVEGEDALARYLGTDSRDPWIWRRLGGLAEDDGRLEEARRAYERGLHRDSGDAALLDGLVRVAQQLGGSEATAQALTRLLEAHPELARARLERGKARFDLALARNDAESAASYALAERDFAAARETDPALEPDALGWQAMCRAGVGWSKLAAGDPRAARDAFASMEELFPGAMRWRIEGRMESGVVGLARAGDAFQAAGALADAAATFERLTAYEPDDVAFANNAGLFDRDLGAATERGADDLERAARGEIRDAARRAELLAAAGLPPGSADDAATRRALARAAERERARAGELFERSFAAYERAVGLAPDDVAVLNDAALILVHHLHRDWERARAWLLHAVELGETQLADQSLARERRAALQNAWGDAHENLGVLALEHDRDVDAARRWFRRAVEIGPDPRPIVTDHWLKRCDELEAGR